MQVITLSQDDLVNIMSELTEALADRLSVRVAIENGFKLSIGGDVWSLPFGADITGRS